jgi:hypothetical protein
MASSEEVEAKLAQSRVAINNAYAFLKGTESVNSFDAVTFEEMMQKHLDRLEGKNGQRSIAEHIAKVCSDLSAAINIIKGVPADQQATQGEKDAGVNS